ncbi:SNF2 DOMAIN-CONTAINING PROTEIN CLASSY 2-RELATED [Salix koriyanagi]|uniref:SNF2 DOMAIN-CONTAINING PROTEIN CLASSY 2-RELATED n=1 Tax=Salix koriyanagi TaxID=2511006 RepID=A0A9Q0PGU1_9ROSI|nr:SNF2 DOMAIN-CONTAINING PROTEIN CLASSY 2-RELATED [Salix koriyanagi]
MKRKRLHESRHPFNALPFEALCCGSWQSVELLQIRDGAMTVHFVDSHHSIEENGPFSNIRVKSRKATLSDCTCFLRPGVDVCVLSSSERAKNTGEGNPEPVWVDAKISSIKRKPHVSHCSCQFFVTLYVNQGRLGSERATLSKETEAVGINEISIVQKLDNDPCEADNNQQEAQFYRWECCVDCSLVQRSKLFKGRFSADLTWLLVASVLKQVEFDVRAVQNKIVYQILGGEKEQCSLKSDNRINCVTFKVKDSILTPFVVQLVPTDACSETGHISDTNGTKQSPCYDVASLRRSKRQNVQPERFLACDAPAETEIGWVRSLPYMPLKWKAAEDDDEEMHLPLAYLSGTHASASRTEEQTRTEVGVGSLKLEPLEGIPVSRTKTGLKEIRSIVVNRREHHTELGEVQAGMAKRIEHRKSAAVNRRKRQKSTMADRIEHQTRLGDAESGMANRKKHGTQIKEVKLGVANRREHNDQLAIVPVHTEDVLMEHTGWTAESKPQNEEDSEPKPDEDEDLSFFGNHTSGEDESVSEVNDNVWDLIPELRPKLHMHQKKAFEFLWQNIAGSLVPALMEKTSKKIGGCVVSHTPGAGKTFLIIAFLVSYLKLFPGKRPLVLAPKTTLYTWYKEFIKWEIPVPVHLIHGTRSSRVFKPTPAVLRGSGPRPSQDVVHILDCLEKMQKWHAQPSVLVMGYTSFLTLMREDAKYSHRKYMAKVLRESPGLLILDEGHNPRSTKSRLRKVLMKVETDQRILLSDNIASKINSDEAEEKMQGLNMLRNMTNRFIDVYEGTASDTLPGLQIYTILMNPTDIQHQILVKLHKIMEKCPGYPLEVELLITLASIHPSLINSSLCVKKFYSMEELMELESQEREGELELFERGRVMDKFEELGGSSRVLLASITACAEGISLTAASRVILLDSEWNPSKTKQAIARAFRPGQQKMVYVYQLLATGTVEEDKYRRTAWKEWVSRMIFKKKKEERNSSIKQEKTKQKWKSDKN